MKQISVILLTIILTIPAYAQNLLRADTPSAIDTQTDAQSVKDALPPGNVNLDFKDADIRNVLRVISLKGGVNIVAGPEVQGTVTIRLQNVPWEAALQVLLKTYGYVFERDGNVVRVTTPDKIAEEPLETKTYFLNYTKATEVSDAISELLSERGKAKAVIRTNTVIVTDTASNLYKITQVITNLDRRTPQAYIDSKIIRTQLDKTENLGINWNVAGQIQGAAVPTTFPFNAAGPNPLGTTAAGSFFPISVNGANPLVNPTNPRAYPFLATQASTIVGQTYTLGTLSLSQFTAILNMLQTRTNTKIVSNPRVVVLDNQTATIQVGQEIGIPQFELNEQTGAYVVNGFEMRKIGVLMEVTPHINNSDEILVEVKPQVSAPGAATGGTSFTPIGGTNLASPQFEITEAYTQALIKDGETIAIGGLISDNRAATYTRVPILGDIPWIGNIFRAKRETPGVNNRKDETIIFVTVGIVDTEGQPQREVPPQITTST